MNINSLKNTVFESLKIDDRIWNEDKSELNQTLLLDLIDKSDEKIIGILLENEELRAKFFIKIKDVFVFKTNDFKFFLEENKINNSYTKYKNQIGLTDGKKFLKESSDVVLNFPFKDCILEGGQSSEEGLDYYFEYEEEKQKTVNGKKIIEPAGYKQKIAKRKEIFFNQILAQDEIDRLIDEKALVGWKRFSNEGKSEVKEIKRDKDGTIKENLIIKGNNLLALHSLKSHFTGKVKLIYIDPPYNTGNDGFKYNDNFNHSTWLTFMKNRLEVARELLRDDGVIFVQCDDNEQAYLKVLMDEVFGRENFVSNFIWKKTNNPNVTKNNLGIETENILSFFRKSFKFFSKNLSSENISEYNKKDQCGYYKLVGLNKTGTINDKRPNLEYVITAPDNSEIKPKPRWRWSKEKFEWALSNNRIVFSKHDRGYSVYYKQYLSEDNNGNQIIRGRLISNLILEKGKTTEGTNEISALLSKGAFNFPKPESLLEELIQISTQPNDIVLDYHLGSATTAAVAHKMNRQYIGIEQMDYIETIAVERMKKVIGKVIKRKITQEEKNKLKEILKKIDNKNKTLFNNN